MLLMRTDHGPVLADELAQVLDPRSGEVAVDATFGAGGHSKRIAEKIGPDGLLIAIDRDSEARRRYDEIEAELPCRSRFIEASFADALAQLAAEQVPVDMVWFDLGVSSMQIDTPERGFSYSAEAPLDMRMDPSVGVTAAEIVAEWDERRLARTFREYGEERYSDRISRAIVRERERQPIETTTELVDIVTAAIPTPARFGAGHPAKRVFQALRIAVNDELEQIDLALPLAWELLRENGRFAGISFQSLEDRRVKQFLAGLARECVCPPGLPICRCGHVSEAKLLTRGGITPTEAETDDNPRARSARMRAALKIAGATS